jgi:hypothetical protein
VKILLFSKRPLIDRVSHPSRCRRGQPEEGKPNYDGVGGEETTRSRGRLRSFHGFGLQVDLEVLIGLKYVIDLTTSRNDSRLQQK